MPSVEVLHLRPHGWLLAAARAAWLALALPALCVMAVEPARAQQEVPQQESPQPQVPPQQVQQAVAALRQETAPGAPLRQHTLRFKARGPSAPDPAKPSARPPASQASPAVGGAAAASLLDVLARYGVWILGFALVALLVVRLHRWVRERADAAFTAAPPVLPSHVHSLDVRPESLPETVGAAAATLWREGEPRAALALLYRGALSRLIHGHGVPVRSASTEGECLALAAGRLDPLRHELFGRLVAAWQQAVYAARLPATERVLALCQDFDRLLGAPAAPQGKGAAP